MFAYAKTITDILRYYITFNADKPKTKKKCFQELQKFNYLLSDYSSGACLFKALFTREILPDNIAIKIYFDFSQ